MKTTFAALLLAAFALPHGALGDDDRDDDRGRWRAEWYGPPGVWVDGPIYRYAYVQAVPPPPVYQGWYYGPPVVDYGWYGPPPGWRVERRWTGRWRDWDDDD
jgi:hypothetical protein